MLEQGHKYEYSIVGGGAHGLSIAYFLCKAQHKIAIFDQFTIGHNNGSSHGPSRIIRSTYQYDFYRDLSKLCLQKYWPQMQKVLDSKFIYQNDFIFFDDVQSSFKSYQSVAKNSNGQLIFTTPQQICQKYPNFPFIKSKFPPIIDTKAGMIGADNYIQRLKQYLSAQPNVAIFQNTQVTKVTNNQTQVRIQTEGDIIRSQKVVLACGRWISKLVPQIQSITTPQKKKIAYLQLQNMQKYQFGRMPSFTQNKQYYQFYATPDRKQLGIKIGIHRIKTKNQQQMETLIKQVASQWFGNKIKSFQFQQCHYTLTKSFQFIIDWTDPANERVLVCSCCSGHGFKFSPILGSIIADILIDNKSIQMFQKNRHTFRIPYHEGINLN